MKTKNLFFSLLIAWILIPTQTFALTCNEKQILGQIEKVKITSKNFVLDAKLDTGAAMSSLSASDISISKSHNQTWVHFIVKTSAAGNKIQFTEPLIRFTRVLKRKEENTQAKSYSTRPVILLPVCLGNQKKNILVNLTDRSDFHYPMLVGSDALKKFKILVDVTQQYSSLPTCS